MPDDRRRRIALPLTTVLVAATVPILAGLPASSASCPDVELIYARASNEPPGTANLGNTGVSFSRALATAIGTGTTYRGTGVDYAALGDQSSAAAGGAAMTRQLVAAAAACPGTRFVLGGGSQGATVTAIALGVRTEFGSAEPIPATLEQRIAAVVVFGNPVRRRQGALPGLAPRYAARTLDICATGDPICDPRGLNPVGHYSYLVDGSIGRGADFAAARVRSAAPGSAVPGPTAPTGTGGSPTPGATAAPPVPPTPSPGTVPVTSPPPTRWADIAAQLRAALRALFGLPTGTVASR